MHSTGAVLAVVIRRAKLALVGLGAALAVAATAAETGGGRRVAVTIDDGPVTGAGNDLAAFFRIADGLREAFVADQVPAIMFVNERQFNVDGQRDARVAVLHTWLEAGLELGNHTYSHPNLGEVETARYLDDIVKGEVITRALLAVRGKKPEWFRYPFLATGRGETAATVERFLRERGYRIAPVTVDYSDYRFAGTYARHLRAGDAEQAEALFATVLQALDERFARAEARSREVLGYEVPLVLLIHCNEMNALTLRRTLARIRARGYRFVALDEAMADPAYATPGLPPGTMGGGGLLNAIAAAKAAKAATSAPAAPAAR